MNNLEQQFLEGIFVPFNDEDDDAGKQNKGKKRGL